MWNLEFQSFRDSNCSDPTIKSRRSPVIIQRSHIYCDFQPWKFPLRNSSQYLGSASAEVDRMYIFPSQELKFKRGVERLRFTKPIVTTKNFKKCKHTCGLLDSILVNFSEILQTFQFQPDQINFSRSFYKIDKVNQTCLRIKMSKTLTLKAFCLNCPFAIRVRFFYFLLTYLA